MMKRRRALTEVAKREARVASLRGQWKGKERRKRREGKSALREKETETKDRKWRP